ncbi:MAG: YidC/Oxa1 family insertase periplasmic-domain containing protein [Candidatus Sumerlaeaceae bacterium]|nr:YidC/Oxa1 family insertase periplasmic-domain containing protein [Candidatus Sumerlaeaceae bacterium]
MERRWLLFFALTFIIVQIFTMSMQPPKKNGAAPQGSTTETLTADASSTGTDSIAKAASIDGGSAQVTAPATARTIENTSITIASHPGQLTSASLGKYEVSLDSIGSVVNSWRLLDTGSDSFEKVVAGTTGGVEMVRRLPAYDLNNFHQPESGFPPEIPPGIAPPPQIWPLEISFKEQNAHSFEDLNAVEWTTREVRDTASGDVIIQQVSPLFRDLRVEKTYKFVKNSYKASLQVTLKNESATTISIYDDLNRGLTLRWGPGLVERKWWEKSTGEEQYDSAVYRSGQDVRVARPQLGKDPIETEGPLQWAGVEAKFFAAMLVPYQPEEIPRYMKYYFRALVPAANQTPYKNFVPPLTMELGTDRFEVGAHGSRSFNFDIYVGPKKYRFLKDFGHNLQSLMFCESWPFMRVIYLFLTDLLGWLHNFVRNYGVAIILLTVLVRLVTFPLTQHSIRIQAKSMAEMAKVKPYIDQINEKYKNDPQEKNRQIWKVYQEHKISPFGALRGCVPMLLQMPVFYGLYRVSSDTIDLQGASFLWIKDLSQPDHLINFGTSLPLIGTHFNLLPILMGATQMIATKVASARMKTMDPTQKQMMYFMPVFLIFVLYAMPAGLMVYWNASNIWQIFQTVITNKQMAREEAKHATAGPISSVPPPPEQPEARKQQRKKKK